MTDQVSEVERVDRIHSFLVSFDQESTLGLCIRDSTNVYQQVYTANEVREFIRLLPAMRRRLMDSGYPAAFAVPSDTGYGCWAGHLDGGGLVGDPPRMVEVLRWRGLYLTREHALFLSWLSEQPGGVSRPEVASPKRDAYAEHQATLRDRLRGDGFVALAELQTVDQAIAAAMLAEDLARDAWKPKEPSNRERLIAALKAELGRPLPRRPSRHDPRPFDLGQAWVTPGDES